MLCGKGFTCAKPACRHCNVRFKNSADVTRHEATCRFRTPTLPVASTRRKAKYEHPTRLERKHACKNCGQTFAKKRNLREHKKMSCPAILTCACGLKLEKSYMEKHRLQCAVLQAKPRQAKQSVRPDDDVVIVGEEFPCKKCSCSYRSAKLLHDHERAVHRSSSHSKPRQKGETKSSVPTQKERKSAPSIDRRKSKLSGQKSCKSKKRPDPVCTNASQRCRECRALVKRRNYNQHVRYHALNHVNVKYLACFESTLGQIYMCRYIACYLAFPSLQELVQHEAVHSGIKPYICGACDEASETRHDHEQHVRTCKFRTLLAYPCGYCGKFFDRSSLLWRHYHSHRPDKMEGYSCGHCREEFPTRLLLNQHNGDTHQIIQPKTRAVVFQCNFCPNKLTSQDELLEHVKTYHLSNIASTSSIGEPTAVHVKAKKPDKRKGRTKVFQCSYCHECFSKESRVTRHERIHTNEKPHVCHICGLAFTFKRELKQHLQKECKVGDADISEKKASFTGMGPEDLENATQDGSDDDDDVICIPSSPSPSPSPPTSIPALGSVHIQRLDPVPVIGQPPSSVAGQISTLDPVTPSVYSTSVALPPSRDQIYLIQYDQTQQGPVSITIPDHLSSAAIRILPTDQNKPSVPVPVRLERLISD